MSTKPKLFFDYFLFVFMLGAAQQFEGLIVRKF